MDDKSDKPNAQAENNSIAIGEINISGTVTGNISIGHTIIQAADAQLRHDLGILLKNVQTTWIKGVLERSVHDAALFDLGMEIRAEAVDNPWRMVMESPDQTREPIPPGKRIKDIYYEANRLLLILGEPGSGKTTTLLQLARDLIAEVDQAFTHPVPVILNLSTWTNKQQPLDKWLVAELNGKYLLPKKQGQRWLEERRILPLLDGLDEVKAENRAACVEKINQLVKDYGLQGLVVCSRVKDYTALNVRLGFYRAIHIQPLTPEQVDEYLRDAGAKLTSLHASLQADETLKSMAQSPLILNIMSLAYQNASAEALRNPTSNTNEARRRLLFDTYIARMFSRKAGRQPYTDEQTKQWLSWLARNMQRHNQEVFLIEGLQPSWLSVRPWEWVYIFTSRLVCGLILMLGLAWLADLDIRGTVIIWLSLGLSISFIDSLRFAQFRKRSERRKSPMFWGVVISAVCMIVGLIVGLFYVIHRGADASSLPSMIAGLILGLFYGLFFGLFFGIRVSRQNPEFDIKTVEVLRWSWNRAAAGGLIGASVGLLVSGLTSLASETKILRFFLDFSRFGTFFGLSGVMLNGLRYEIIETKSEVNQGIHLSIRNAIFGGLIFVLIGGLTGGISRLISGGGNFDRLIAITANWSRYAGMGAIWFGGLDTVQHYTLRLILLIKGYTPRNYARFLDYAVDHIFLQKVGGGYRFIHRLLLEHFADMSEATKQA